MSSPTTTSSELTLAEVKVRRLSLHYFGKDSIKVRLPAQTLLLLHGMFHAFNLAILRRASDIVVLNRLMAERVGRKAPVAHKMHTLPPWPQDGLLESIPHAQTAFRQRYVPTGRLAVMYSGLHTPANPLTTLREAAQRLQADPRVLLMCIGGGNGKKEVDDKIAASAANILSLPCQPLAEIKCSLSAADAHVVSMGDNTVGIVHPCKVYCAMTVARDLPPLGSAPKRALRTTALQKLAASSAKYTPSSMPSTACVRVAIPTLLKHSHQLPQGQHLHIFSHAPGV